MAGGDGRTPGSGASGSGRWTRARLVGLRGLTAGAWEVMASEPNRKLGRKQQFVQEETMASEKNLGPKGPCSSPSLSPLWRSGFLRCPLIQIPSSGHVTLAFLRFCLEEERLTSEVTPLRAVRAPRPDREPCAPLHSWREATSGWPVETRTLPFACPSRPRASRLFAGGRVVLARPSSPAQHLGQTPSALGKRARGKVAVTRTWLPTDTGSCRVSERELRLDEGPGSARRGDH